MTLNADHFPEFYREVNGYDPFPWQYRLLRALADGKPWPDQLNLPTGSGKTSVLEIAVFHLALQAEEDYRTAAMRIALVADRRLIVDQGERQAQKMRQALRQAAGNATPLVAKRLQALSGGTNAEPLHVAKMRGGIPGESLWARTPTQPTILLSTVDQVGSRLLFRGYGVSDSSKPIHAGLLGEDCQVFLDEAHLSEAFRQTARAIGARLSVLTATPTAAPGISFRLEEDDREHAVLKLRLSAAKPAELVEGNRFVEEAKAFATHGNVLVVVNRVALARQVYGELAKEFGSRVALLTGRVRELDRRKILARIEPYVRTSGRETAEPIVVVATQTIEAGADLDFDYLVTQIAPMDSLKQRFGRLNRMGRPIAARAKIVALREDLNKKKPDPVYGERMAACWEYLRTIEPLDFGIQSLRASPAETCTQPKDAPVLPPVYLDFWTQTSPLPSVEPDVALFLHGEPNAAIDVNLVWRSDLGPFETTSDAESDRIQRLLQVFPPRTGETMAVPLHAVRAWLDGRRPALVSDLEGGAEPESPESSGGRGPRRAFRWHPTRSGFVWAKDLRPGDTLIVPSSYGGCDEYGWDPTCTAHADDLAEEAAEPYEKRNFFVRVHRSQFQDFTKDPPDPDTAAWHSVKAALQGEDDGPEEILDRLLTLSKLPEPLKNRLERLEGAERIAIDAYQEHPEEEGVVLHVKGVAAKDGPAPEESLAESDEEASFRTASATLAGHTAKVVEKVREFTRPLPIAGCVKDDLALAAELHDIGKGDRRFQAYLHGNVAFAAAEPLAKSSPPRGFEKGLWERLQLPAYWRHEALSVRMALQDERFRGAHDPPLVLWLVGTHHGHGRPFFPHRDPLDARDRYVVTPDGSTARVSSGHGPQEIAFDFEGRDWPSLFAELQARYGAWRLAYYESILRLADHRASEEGDA